MKILVFGAGGIGSYLTHVLCQCKHDVTLVARGDWKKELEDNGLSIYHYLQKKTTKEYPTVISNVGSKEHYDAVFVVMQYQQMQKVLVTLSAINTPVVVLIGNNMSSSEMQAYLEQHSKIAKKVYFGFCTVGGHREKTRVISVRKSTRNLYLGSISEDNHQEATSFFDKIFGNKYRPIYVKEMDAWLKYHLAMILPIAYLSYSLNCNLKKSTGSQRRLVTNAIREGYQLLKRLGYPVQLEKEELYFKPGFRRMIMDGMLLLMAKTKIGELAVTDHCKAAVNELQSLDIDFTNLRKQVCDFDMPYWEQLKRNMPDWNELNTTYH